MGILCQNITVNLNNDVNSGSHNSGIVTGTAKKVAEQLFDGKVPTTLQDESWVKNYMTTVKVKNFSVTVHKKVANDVRNIINEIIANNYSLKSIGGYQFRYVNNGSGSHSLSIHSYGVALDINADKIPNSGLRINGFNKLSNMRCDPNAPNDMNPGIIRTLDHPVCKIFKKYGWGWGGTYGDYMHFSLCDGH